MLGLEASSVVATRMARVARGGAEADREIELMMSEKIEAGQQLQAKLPGLGAGAVPETAMARPLKHCRGKVDENRRRLAR
jgi:hypothetical protein